MHLFCIQKGKKWYQVPEEILCSGTVKCFSGISWGLCCLQMLVSICLSVTLALFRSSYCCLLQHHISTPPQHHAWFLFLLIFFVHWYHFPSWLLLIFVCHFFPIFFWFYSLTLAWPSNCNEFSLLWNWHLLAPWCFSTLSFLISFSDPCCRFLSCIFCDLKHPSLFLLLTCYSFPSQPFLSGIFLFFLPYNPIAVKPWGTHCKSPTGFLLFTFLVATFNNKFTFSLHAILQFQRFPVTSQIHSLSDSEGIPPSCSSSFALYHIFPTLFFYLFFPFSWFCYLPLTVLLQPVFLFLLCI